MALLIDSRGRVLGNLTSISASKKWKGNKEEKPFVPLCGACLHSGQHVISTTDVTTFAGIIVGAVCDECKMKPLAEGFTLFKRNEPVEIAIPRGAPITPAKLDGYRLAVKDMLEVMLASVGEICKDGDLAVKLALTLLMANIKDRMTEKVAGYQQLWKPRTRKKM